jgi:hypothetical protein
VLLTRRLERAGEGFEHGAQRVEMSVRPLDPADDQHGERERVAAAGDVDDAGERSADKGADVFARRRIDGRFDLRRGGECRGEIVGVVRLGLRDEKGDMTGYFPIHRAAVAEHGEQLGEIEAAGSERIEWVGRLRFVAHAVSL